ncbi:Amidohydrolase 3 [Desulfatibacillum aliphaticivorans]|uniref:Amidohydrolase 3 n=1 Tax=Desulfatibacillum aliphaticivorans TaxID=218208 RepID=B8FFN7_DESAL|nr:amidohydrolase family protein [Desulfatibacillum aliphaticivorans]ACL03442.1 Amidohydrolase 3 [Desulfatibacillum aliphaticivorans]
MHFDLVIEQPSVFNGSGTRAVIQDVGVKDGKIQALGNLAEAEAGERIYARDMGLCPGFIDVHTHADMALHRPEQVEVLAPLVRQGITTIVGGNCGAGMGPISDRNADFQYKFYEIFLGKDQQPYITWQGFGEMLESLEAGGLLVNTAMLAPHGILRMHAMGDSVETAGPDDLAVMIQSLRECLEAGAVGMSTGLQYFPGLCSDSRELLELAKVLAEYDGVFTSHLRSYNSNGLQNAMDEIMDIGREAEVPVQLSHLFWIPYMFEPLNTIMKAFVKAASRLYKIHPFPIPLDSSTKSHMAKVARLVDKGQPIGVDAMPTSAGFTHLFAFFPPWSLEGGLHGVMKRIADPKDRLRIRKSIENGKPVWPHRGPDSWSMNLFKIMGWDCASVMSVTSEKNQKYIGMNFGEIGKAQGKHPFDAACDLALEENGRVLIFETPTYPGDPMVELSLQGTLMDPNVSIGTDYIPLGFGKPSHLTYDCFPKFLGQYARDWKLLALPEAIRKCTELPASQINLPNRGNIAEGYYADMVLFDPETIGSNSTAQDPAHSPKGIHMVFINGRKVVDGDDFSPDPLPGMMIRR